MCMRCFDGINIYLKNAIAADLFYFIVTCADVSDFFYMLNLRDLLFDIGNIIQTVSISISPRIRRRAELRLGQYKPVVSEPKLKT